MVIAQHNKILIVDDDPEMLDLIAEHFSVFGFKVYKTNSGNSALDILKEESVNIVISDIHMEDGNGIDLLNAIKSKNVFTPSFYFISGYSDHQLREVMSMGADGLFHKPFDASTLRSSIKKSLLPRRSHWSTKPCETQELKSVNLDKDSTSWGRGGFSFVFDIDYKVGEFINFSSDWFEDDKEGTGRVVWIDQNKAGVEIEYLPPSSIAEYEKYLEDNSPLSYIPA